MKLTLVQKIEAFVVGLVILIAVIALVHRDGEKKGAVKEELKANASHVKELKADAVVVHAQTIAKRKEYHAARAKVQVKGDSVIADGQRVNMPSVATLIKAADVQVAQDSTDQAKQNLLVGALGKRADLLEREKEPWCGKKCGVAIGVAGTVGAAWLVVKVVLPLLRHK